MNVLVAATLSLAVSSAVVLPSLHAVFRPPAPTYIGGDGPSPMARELLSEQLARWDEGQRDVDRRVNPEWDLGHHTFFALALVNVALANAAQADDREAYRVRVDVGDPAERGAARLRRSVDVGDPAERGAARLRRSVDAVLDELRARPPEHYHLPYFHGEAFHDAKARSLFLDGEVLLVLAARLIAWPDAAKHAELEARARGVVEQMSQSPTLMAESYPDECWMFDNTAALAALVAARTALGRPIEGADALTERWLARAKKSVDPHTGMLVASTTWEGKTLDGPEGSSAFGVAHFLQVVDAPFAAEQYDRAKKELVVRPLGFAYAHEWPDPRLWKADPLPPRAGSADVDSGPVIPFVHAGAGASGMAFLGAAAFRDDVVLGELVTSLELAAFPERNDGRLRFLASNGIGDAVMLYSLVQGPLWRRVGAGAGAAQAVVTGEGKR